MKCGTGLYSCKDMMLALSMVWCLLKVDKIGSSIYYIFFIICFKFECSPSLPNNNWLQVVSCNGRSPFRCIQSIESFLQGIFPSFFFFLLLWPFFFPNLLTIYLLGLRHGGCCCYCCNIDNISSLLLILKI